MCRRAKRVGQTLTVVIVLAATRSLAEPVHIITEQPRLLCHPLPSTLCREVPPGHFVDQDSWSKLDTELRRTQDSETGLRAENRALRESMSGWSPGWKVLTGALIVGLAGGIYLGTQL
jgi:hypothetical protein